ncbi:MAG TPA: hypothetical protein VHZ50_05125 [Puia sp.]|jgi:phosphate/sulfate permease|nr:hypothetical protein [Puia sp.]
MENENQLDSFFKINFDDDAREQLKTIVLWARICAICAFISYTVALIVAIFGKTISSTYSDQGYQVTSYIRTWAIASALISGIIGFAINYFLYRFAADTKQGLEVVDQVKLNEGLSNLKTYFKIVGILLLIVLIIVGLIILFAIIGSLNRGGL